ncbi:LPS assembly lipoprotein LptE [Sulfitobacter guttiformis]|uniref:LPS-assembly lipoprotein n=1 Tax=Sulfitobacter guttiformis TaxID=74349 RepID=A0A420DSZ1_9RHOB|nr:LPS assembly lipoprotein LptE [Sulfitobacter guttiformis]KIN74708.1 putative lipoprotein [Sulfitobacter guttiformis KCTC 32187]RKE97283.1 LPS-assembly lipoprotein [Sulfitobacter guttiformis]
MSLYSRRSLLALPLALAACGFTPVYGIDGTGSKLRNQVLVAEPSTQAGYLLTRQLETRLGRSDNAARYALDLTIDTSEEGLAINPAGDITRFNLIGRVDYALRDMIAGTVVTSGKVENFTAYSAIGTTVAALAAERDAIERLMVILGDQITARLFAADLPV